MIELEAYDYGRCHLCDGAISATENGTWTSDGEPEICLMCWFCDESREVIPLSSIPQRFGPVRSDIGESTR